MPLDPTHRRCPPCHGDCRQGRVCDAGDDKIGVPGTGVVLAVMLTAACFAIGWVAFEAFMALRRWFA